MNKVDVNDSWQLSGQNVDDCAVCAAAAAGRHDWLFQAATRQKMSPVLRKSLIFHHRAHNSTEDPYLEVKITEWRCEL